MERPSEDAPLLLREQRLLDGAPRATTGKRYKPSVLPPVNTKRTRDAFAFAAFFLFAVYAVHEVWSYGSRKNQTSAPVDYTAAGKQTLDSRSPAQKSFLRSSEKQEVTDYDSDFASAKSDTCSEFDDDDTYTADVCSPYDTNTCYGHRKGCNSSYFCSNLCGDMCSEGAGAICYYEKISHLKETCESAATLRRSTSDVMGAAPMVQSTTPGDGYGLHDDLRDEGCGMHVFCGYCTGDCATSEVERYLSVTYNGSTHQPFIMKEAVEHILDTCRHFGYRVDDD
jgi:hypothetical protein